MAVNSAPDDAVRAACFASDEVQALQTGLDAAVGDPSVVSRGFGTAAAQAEKDSRSRTAIADWATCMTAAGVPAEEKGVDAFFAVVDDRLSEEESITRALIDTGCKEKVSLVQRMADIEAAYQLKYIEKHQAALSAERAKADEVVNRAKAIAERG